MDCKFAEKISALIDDELAPVEIEQTKTHLSNCAECQSLKKDFLNFRRQIKGFAVESGSLPANRQALSRKTPFWKKRILLPTPVFALLLLLLVMFGVLTISLNLNRKKEAIIAAEDPAKKTQSENKIRQNSASEVSLSRFDKGRRAEIYTIGRQVLNKAEKSESAQQ